MTTTPDTPASAAPEARPNPSPEARPNPTPEARQESEPPLKIAVFYPWVYLTSGAERTLVEVARNSRHRVTIFTTRYEPEATFPELKELDLRVLDQVPVQRSIHAVGFAALRIAGRRIDLDSFDALMIVSEGLGDLVTLRNHRIPVFCLCLTPLRIVFDPVYRESYLEDCGPLKKLVLAAGSWGFRLIDRLAWRHYRRVFAISNEVRKRIIAGGLATDDKMEILNPGVDLSAFRPSDQADRTFFVPGRIMWTKNLELAIDAFKQFRAKVEDAEGWKLRIAGIVDRKSQPYLERLRRLAGDDPAIEFVIRPDDEEMLRLYRTCFATLFTAFNEDWGLVILEAMASAKPTVSVDRGGPREIVTDGENGLLAPPEPEAFAAAMLRLVAEPELRRRLCTEGPPHAARFTWQRYVADLDQAIAGQLTSNAGETAS